MSEEDGAAADRRPTSIAELVLDLAVFVPLGAVDLLRQEVPAFVRDRRHQVDQQLRTARWVGEMAVRMGQSKLAAALAARRAPAPPSRPAPEAAPASAPVARADEAPAEPFEGYDALPAVDLVPLLERLSAAELAAVQGYETATRGRRTVLARVEQLLAA